MKDTIKSKYQEFSYDQNGNTIEILEFRDSSLIEKTTRKYDKSDSLVAVLIYDANGKLKEKTIFERGLPNNSLINFKNIDCYSNLIKREVWFRYNDKGKISEIKMIGNASLNYSVELESEEDNFYLHDTIKEEYIYGSSSTQIIRSLNPHKTKSIYYPENREVKKDTLLEIYENGKIVFETTPEDTIIYHYENGLLILEESFPIGIQKFFSGKGTVRYEYDSNKNLTSEVTKGVRNDSISYIYNNGKLLEERSYFHTNKEPSFFAKSGEIKKYNGDGLLREKITLDSNYEPIELLEYNYTK